MEKEILKLKTMLEEANIPFVFTDDMFKTKDLPEHLRGFHVYEQMFPAYQIVINDKLGNRLCDAVCHYMSYGHNRGLLEIMDALTKEELDNDCVKGCMDAEEAFKRFKYCYENSTEIYREE